MHRGQLSRLVANTRFLMLPSVRVPHLASHVLGMLVRQLPQDWEVRYGIRPLLLETFVHPDHDGTCYKAAGWEHVGVTAGRRDGVPKAVWLRPLAPDALRSRFSLKPTVRPSSSTWPRIDWCWCRKTLLRSTTPATAAASRQSPRAPRRTGGALRTGAAVSTQGLEGRPD